MSALHFALASFYDALVVPSFCHAGFAARAATWDPRALEVDLAGRGYLVTGANAGLGRATAEALFRRGADVHMLVRDRRRGEAARDAILNHGGHGGRGALHLHQVDVSLLAEVRRFAAAYLASGRRLDALVHNAGVLPGERVETAEGIERTFATNVLGPFLLTGLLTPALSRQPGARVVWVSSGGMYTQRLRVDDLQFRRPGFDGVLAYAQTKRAEVYLAERFALRLAPQGVVVNSMHPGWADTPGVQGSLPRFRALTRRFLRSPEEGADTIVWLAIAEKAGRHSGQFFLDRRPRPTHLPGLGTRSTPEEIDRLWAECQRLSGWSD